MTLAVERPERGLELNAQDHEHRQEHDREQRKLPVEPEHDHKRHDDRRGVNEQERESVEEEVRYSVGIASYTCHEAAGLLARKEA